MPTRALPPPRRLLQSLRDDPEVIAPKEAPFVVEPFITWTTMQDNGAFVTVTAVTNRPWEWEMHCFVAWPDRVRDSPLWGSAL